MLRRQVRNLRPLTTTTIGSFPLPPGIEEFKRSIEIQVKAGIDYPALPQLEDFCLIFLRDIAERGKGLERKGELFVLTGPIEPPKEPAIIQEIALAIATLKELGVQKGLKIQVTGPLTLSSLVKFLDKTAMSYPDIVESFADAIADILAAASSFEEVEVAFIDEPTTYYALWHGYDEKFVINVINRALKGLGSNVERGIHICGDARGLSRVTLNLHVDVIHHEMAGFPKNFDAYNPVELAKTGKMLGIGAVTTKPIDTTIKVESEGEIEELIRRALERYDRRIVVAPDCGFRGLMEVTSFEDAFKTTYLKIKAMTDVAKKIRRELKLDY
ncbi:MAG: uroporphyrinogen decarboxylase/cobalamine-independent methonine synthase family protein [Candidatus Nezhaarchaeales archaeon]